MEKHLSNLTSNLELYKIELALTKINKEKYKQQHKDFKLKYIQFYKKIAAYKNQIQPLFNEVDLEVRLQGIGTNAYIVNELKYDECILLSVAPKKESLRHRMEYSGFIAFCGDYKTNKIHIYEFCDAIDRDDFEDNLSKRLYFKDHARLICDIDIDEFEIAHIQAAIEDYMAKELDYLAKKE